MHAGDLHALRVNTHRLLVRGVRVQAREEIGTPPLRRNGNEVDIGGIFADNPDFGGAVGRYTSLFSARKERQEKRETTETVRKIEMKEASCDEWTKMFSGIPPDIGGNPVRLVLKSERRPNTALAFEPGTAAEEPGKTELSLTVFFGTEQEGFPDVEFRLYRVGDMDLSRAEFTLTGAFEQYSVPQNAEDSSEWKALAETLHAYVVRMR